MNISVELHTLPQTLYKNNLTIHYQFLSKQEFWSYVLKPLKLTQV